MGIGIRDPVCPTPASMQMQRWAPTNTCLIYTLMMCGGASLLGVLAYEPKPYRLCSRRGGPLLVGISGESLSFHAHCAESGRKDFGVGLAQVEPAREEALLQA